MFWERGGKSSKTRTRGRSFKNVYCFTSQEKLPGRDGRRGGGEFCARGQGKRPPATDARGAIDPAAAERGGGKSRGAGGRAGNSIENGQVGGLNADLMGPWDGMTGTEEVPDCHNWFPREEGSELTVQRSAGKSGGEVKIDTGKVPFQKKPTGNRRVSSREKRDEGARAEKAGVHNNKKERPSPK